MSPKQGSTYGADPAASPVKNREKDQNLLEKPQTISILPGFDT
jgi:hypothetical protein